MLRKTFVALALLLGFSTAAVPPAEAQCPAFLCYADLWSGFTVCPNSTIYTKVVTHPIGNGPQNPTCDTALWKAALVEVTLPPECEGISVWLEYFGEPEGWTANVGDSPTNNGFGGDAGSQPTGQNAEVQILDELLSVFNAASVPEEVDRLVHQELRLRDGGFKLVAEDQFLSWGQPYGEIESSNLERMFFLSPQNANRTLYVGVNRVIASNSAGDVNVGRNGCGVRHAMIFTH